MPTISIITVTLNNLAGLISTYESIKEALNYSEWIIVDGLSSDGTVDYVKRNILTKHESVRFINEKDDSLYDAMNKGVKIAAGEHLLFLNSGDKLLFSIKKLQFLQIHFADITVFNIRKTYNGKELKWHGLLKDKNMLKKIPLPHQSTFIRKKILEDFNYYNDNYKYLGDHDFFCRCLTENKNFTFYPEIILSEFDMTGVSSNPRMALKILRELQQIHRQYFKIRVPLKTTAVYYLKYIFSFVPNSKENLHYLRTFFFKSN